MRLLLSWVRDFVNVTASADDVAEKLALRGFEVAAIETMGNDAVIDFEVTANRPDCLSVLGFAREIGTLYDLPVRLPSVAPGSRIALANVPVDGEGSGPGHSAVSVHIDDAELCPRYAAAVADVKATTSPQWMTTRLQAAGVRPISPFVDITNYVLMEIGHPMHAFDLERIGGHEIRVRRARAGEKVVTLDGSTRTLEDDMLVIADRHDAQAVAGVMGGQASEVSETTKTVVFESAYFKPSSVRRTGKRLGLKTEASSRFERGADINAPVLAMRRALALMQNIGAGKVNGPIVDRYPSTRGPRTLHLRRERLATLLGLRVPDAEVVRILTALGLTVGPTNDGWTADVPTFRVDLSREVDLIEEVGRHYGLDKLEPLFPPVTVAAAAPDSRIPRDQLVRRTLTGAGFSEAVTFGIIEAEPAHAFAPNNIPAETISVANPLSAKFEVLRPSLIPGLLNSVAHNRRHGRRDVALFEVGARFSKTDGETRGVAIAATGSATGLHWSGASRGRDLYDMKGIVELLCDALSVKVEISPVTSPFLVRGQSAQVTVQKHVIGLFGQLSPERADAAGAPHQDSIFVAELNLDRLAEHRLASTEWVHALPRHPSVVRDLSIVVSASLPAEIIRGTIQAAAADLAAPLVHVAFFDRYRGKGVPDEAVSLSVRLTFQASDRTLTDQDVQHAFDKILSALVREHDAVQR